MAHDPLARVRQPGASLVDSPGFRLLVAGIATLFLIILLALALQLAQRTEQETLRRLAKSHTELIISFRNFYSTVILPVVRAHSDLEITHDYARREGALPIPATLTLDLVQYLNQRSSGMQLRLVSDHPFPWRAGRQLDAFEGKALAELQRTGLNEFHQVVHLEGGKTLLRYAAPIRLEASCVDCHNLHPDSPKRDWKEGDVRGIQVITMPLEGITERALDPVLPFAGFVLAFLVLALLALFWVHGRNVRAARLAEERAEDLRQALVDLDDRQRALDAHAIVSIADPDGNIVYANDKFCELSGYHREELLGRKHNIIKSGLHEPAFYQAMWDTLCAGRIWQGEICNRAKDGHLYWVTSTIVPFLDAAGKPRQFIAVRTDITRRKAVEAELEEKRAQAEAANRAKSEFLATMSHEIRTPMNGIIGMTGLLLDTPLNEEQREYARIVQDSAEALLTVINDILDFSKMEAGKLDIVQEPFHLDELVANLASILRPRAGEKGIELRVDIAREASGHYLGDANRLRQILLNLAGNALKFTHQGHVELAFRRTADGRLRVCVTDTGIGISPEAQGKLFGMFNQVDSSITRRYGGTGLGLAISRRLVELMGGGIGVESSPGAGSRFWFELPLARREDAPAGEGSAEAAPAPQTAPGARVLVTEDNRVNQTLARRLLEKYGLTVTLAENGCEALERLGRESFDLVFMDMEMPEMDGLAATRAIRALGGVPAGVPIIAMTANALSGDREACLAAGMNDFISKPLDRTELQRLLERWLPLREKEAAR